FLTFEHMNKTDAAARFVTWLEQVVIADARGDQDFESDVNPTGRYWLGRLGPKDDVVNTDARGDRLEPCAIGLRIKPRRDGPWSFKVRTHCVVWQRSRNPDRTRPWRWSKLPPVSAEVSVEIVQSSGESILGREALDDAFGTAGVEGLSAEIRVAVTGTNK